MTSGFGECDDNLRKVSFGNIMQILSDCPRLGQTGCPNGEQETLRSEENICKSLIKLILHMA